MSGSSAAARAEEKRVLVVDDSRSVCWMIERMLRPRGFDVVTAHTGRQALERLEQGATPDLVLCDLLLPDLPGVEVCRFVRRAEALRHVPVVLISARADEGVRGEAEAAGAACLLTKPFQDDALMAKIIPLLGFRSSAAPLPARRFLAACAALPGLRGGRWQLAGGEAGGWGESAAADPAPEAILAGLGGLLPRGFGQPAVLCLEAGSGEVLLAAYRPERGSLLLLLSDTASLGKARYLARMFLRTLPAPSANPPSTNEFPRKEVQPWNP